MLGKIFRAVIDFLTKVTKTRNEMKRIADGGRVVSSQYSGTAI